MGTEVQLQSSGGVPSPINPFDNIQIVNGKFFIIQPDLCEDNQVVAKCVKCKPNDVFIRGHGKSSSNFLSHLKRIHGAKALEEYKKERKDFGKNFRRYSKTRNQSTLPIKSIVSSSTSLTSNRNPNHDGVKSTIENNVKYFDNKIEETNITLIEYQRPPEAEEVDCKHNAGENSDNNSLMEKRSTTSSNELFTNEELISITKDIILSIKNCKSKEDQFLAVTTLALKYLGK